MARAAHKASLGPGFSLRGLCRSPQPPAVYHIDRRFASRVTIFLAPTPYDRVQPENSCPDPPISETPDQHGSSKSPTFQPFMAP